MAEDPSLLFKVVIIGDSGVGKSNLMTRYTSNDFGPETQPTIGVEFMTKNVKVGGRDAKVQIWDTAGQERFRAISRSIYHGAKGALLVYDITRQETFDNIPQWLQELKVHVHATCQIFLIGNKCDLDHLRVVKKETADRFARENGLSFLETSALDSTNVEKAFQWLVKSIFDVVVSQQDTNVPRAPTGARPKGVAPNGAVPLGAAAPKPDKGGKGCKC
jgi:small GTP-binding protein